MENLIKKNADHLATSQSTWPTWRARHGGPLARVIAAGKPHPLFPQRLLVQKTWSATFFVAASVAGVVVLAFVAGVLRRAAS